MSALLPPASVSLSSIAEDTLRATARAWFFVAISGQMMQAAYVTWFYGRTALQGQVEAWDRVLSRGYIRGDAAGNAAVIVHLLAAVILVVGGAMQFIPRVRDRAPRLHRWTGRIYLVTAVAASLAGLYMTWVRGTRGDVSQHVGGSLNAILIMLCAFFALRTALARRFDAHRRWALRLFLVVSGSWFYRVGLFLWVLVNEGPVGFDLATFRGPTLTFLSFANSIVPLVVLELYLHAQNRAAAPGRLAMAAALFIMTVAMGIGILAATMVLWLPIIRTGQLSFNPF
ncbi:MAG: DUF2306 domain-containing protein [Thermoanaerobaculia bacterium]